MKKIWAVALKELLQAFRDPISLVMLLGLPTFMLLLYGYALNFDVKHIALAVQDLDKSTASRDLTASFVNSTYFDLVAALPAGADFGKITERRQARAILVIPEDYSRKVAAGEKARVQIIIDGSDANTAVTLLGYASAIVSDANVEIMRGTLASLGQKNLPAISYEPRVWYNPELLSTHFLVPGLIGFIIMLTAVLSTALSVVREKERGTLEQIRVAPISAIQLITGKTLPYLGISLLATAIILVAARFLFGVVIQGPYLDLFIATLLYLIGALGFGLLVSSFAETQSEAFQTGFVASMLPALILSGFIFPIRSMPKALQIITYAVPARYYLVILRGVILKGAGLAPYRNQVWFLTLYSITVLGIAILRLRRKEA